MARKNDTVQGLPSRYKGLGLLALILAVLPAFVQSSYLLSVLIFIGLYTILTVGLCLLMGYAGQISLGHAAFYGLGAYTSGIVTTRYGVSPWLGILLSMAVTGGVAAFLARPIFKLRGHFLAMATLGLGHILVVLFNEASGLTGGPSGLTGIPYLSIGGWAFDRDVRYFYLVWGAVVLTMLMALNIVDSRVGRALRAVRSSEVAAQSIGADIARLKAQTLVISGVTAGLAGSLYAHYVTFLSPKPFAGHTTIMLLVMATIGGVSTIWGALLGAALVTSLTEVLRALAPRLLRSASAEYEIIVFGVLLIVIMLRMPQGLAPELGKLRLRQWRRKLTAFRLQETALPSLRRWMGVEGQEGTQ
jgi:branched-chain amino acid transport system permease protein